MREYILCAGNLYLDGKSYPNQPNGVDGGFVIAGLRHANCITTFSILRGFPYSDETKKIKNTEVQGFITNKNKFVSREEAAQIAFDSGQINTLRVVLYSEDIY